MGDRLETLDSPTHQLGCLALRCWLCKLPGRGVNSSKVVTLLGGVNLMNMPLGD